MSMRLEEGHEGVEIQRPYQPMAAPILQIAWQLSPTVLSRTKASQSSTGSPSPVM